MNASNCEYPVVLVTVQYGEFRDEVLHQDEASLLNDLDTIRRLRSIELVTVTDSRGRSVWIPGFSGR